MYKLEPIGIAQSCYLDKFGTPRQPGLVPEATAKIEIFKKFQPELSLQGLETFSHVWVLFLFHKNTNSGFSAKVHPPRLEGKTLGLFSTRTPHRPNPIGLSLVKLERVLSDGIVVSGVDLIDDTPVLDIKPYLPSVESVPEAVEGWSDPQKSPWKTWEVQWSPEAETQLHNWIQASGKAWVKVLVEKTLCLDPRPQVYKENPNHKDSHAVRIMDRDVHFVYQPESILVTQVLPI